MIGKLIEIKYDDACVVVGMLDQYVLLSVQVLYGTQK